MLLLTLPDLAKDDQRDISSSDTESSAAVAPSHGVIVSEVYHHWLLTCLYVPKTITKSEPNDAHWSPAVLVNSLNSPRKLTAS